MGSISLGQIAELLGCELLDGDSSAEITGVSTLEKAGPKEVTFLANLKYAPKAKSTRAGAVLAAAPVENPGVPTLLSANPYHDFARIQAYFYKPAQPAPGVHPTA